MKIKGIIINDVEAKKYFAFVNQFPGVCAQGDSMKEVKVNIMRNFRYFIERMRNEDMEYTEEQIKS